MSDPVDRLTPEQREEVEQIRKALEQELQDNASPTSARKAIRDLEDIKSDALAAISHAVKFSQNETLKTKIGMWIMDKLIADGKATVDPLLEFQAGMDRAKERQLADSPQDDS